jgi:hypothetical protein
MMVEAAPGTTLEVARPQFLLEFLEVALDAPVQLGNPDQLLERRGGREIGQLIPGGFGAAFRPLNEQPLLVMREGAPVVAVGDTYPEGGKARTHHANGTLTPSHCAPGCGRKSEGQFTHRLRLVGSIAAQQLGWSTTASIWRRSQRHTALGPHRGRALDPEHVLKP